MPEDPAPDGKRQRKKPKKLQEDYVDLEVKNKAARFFENKKAECKTPKVVTQKSAKKQRNRLPSAYTLWCNSYRPKLQAQIPGLDFATLNKKLGEIWWSIPLKEKTIWKRKAKRLATHGLPKSSDVTTYLGRKSIESVKKHHPTPAGRTAAKAAPTQGSAVRHGGSTAGHVKPADKSQPTYKITHTEPVDIAAHLMLMSESITAIGKGLKARGDMPVQGAMDMLLDTLLCGMSSLMCLTQQVPELDGDTDPDMHRQTIANIAYYIPDV